MDDLRKNQEGCKKAWGKNLAGEWKVRRGGGTCEAEE